MRKETNKKTKKQKLTRVGFEPTPPKRVQLECTALDRSAIAPRLLLSGKMFIIETN